MPIKGTKKETRKAKEGRGGALAKAERKVKTAVSLLNPKTKFCFLRMPELCNLIFSFGSESREVFDL